MGVRYEAVGEEDFADMHAQSRAGDEGIAVGEPVAGISGSYDSYY
jgi:hypothetical protein